MPDRKDRAQLGEQVSERNSTEQGDTSEENRSANSRQNPDRGKDRVARDSTDRSAEDSLSGDEGIDEPSITRSASESSTRQNSRNRDVREDSSLRPGSAQSPKTGFTGRGGQKEAESEEAEGTGYTGDRSGQLQDDGSLSGSQRRPGKTGNDQSHHDNRTGGQTAQNPRGSEVDRPVV